MELHVLIPWISTLLPLGVYWASTGGTLQHALLGKLMFSVDVDLYVDGFLQRINHTSL